MSKIVLPIISSRIFMVYKSLIYFEFILYMV